MVDNFERGERETIRHPENLYWEIPVEFISPLPIETCINQLFSMDNSHKWFERFVMRQKFVRMYEMDDGAVYFYIYMPRGYYSIWLIARMQIESNHRTLVSGKIGAKVFRLMMPLVWHDAVIFRDRLKADIEATLSNPVSDVT